MKYTEEQVREAYFAQQILDDVDFPGDVAAVWSESVGASVPGLESDNTLTAWERRYRRGLALLDEARLVVGGPTPLSRPRSGQVVVRQDGPIITVLAGQGDQGPIFLHVTLVARD